MRTVKNSVFFLHGVHDILLNFGTNAHDQFFTAYAFLYFAPSS